MLGVFLGSLSSMVGRQSVAELAALFGTTLAPIAGSLRLGWGLVAGFVHASAA